MSLALPTVHKQIDNLHRLARDNRIGLQYIINIGPDGEIDVKFSCGDKSMSVLMAVEEKLSSILSSVNKINGFTS